MSLYIVYVVEAFITSNQKPYMRLLPSIPLLRVPLIFSMNFSYIKDFIA